MFYKTETLAVFIDGQNTHAATNALNLKMDFRKLHDYMKERGQLKRISYYTPLLVDEGTPVKSLCDFLEYNQYRVVTRPIRKYRDGTGRDRVKCGMQVQITMDILAAAEFADHIVLFSGDGDFAPLVDAVTRTRTRVTVVSTLSTDPVIVSDDLRRAADDFIDLLNLPIYQDSAQERSSPARAA